MSTIHSIEALTFTVNDFIEYLSYTEDLTNPLVLLRALQQLKSPAHEAYVQKYYLISQHYKPEEATHIIGGILHIKLLLLSEEEQFTVLMAGWDY